MRAQRVLLAHAPGDSLGDRAPRIESPYGVPEAVVDALEVVDVEKEQRDDVAVPRGERKRLSGAVAQEIATGQSGERVFIVLTFELFLVVLAFGDVVDDSDEVRGVTRRVAHRAIDRSFQNRPPSLR